MEEDLLFEEQQMFGGKAIHSFFLMVTGILLLGSLGAYLLGGEDRAEAQQGLLAGTIITGLASLFLGWLRLTTQIRQDGIYVRYRPFQRSLQRYGWEDISRVFIRQYNPLMEYGGWGLRWSRNGRAYNVSGNTGIQIIFKDGSKLLIGTNCPEEVAAVLHRLRRLSPPEG